MERIVLKKTKRKCMLCAKIDAGVLMRNDRHERLLPVFLCRQCMDRMLSFLQESGKEEK